MNFSPGVPEVPVWIQLPDQCFQCGRIGCFQIYKQLQVPGCIRIDSSAIGFAYFEDRVQIERFKGSSGADFSFFVCNEQRIVPEKNIGFQRAEPVLVSQVKRLRLEVVIVGMGVCR